MGKRHVCSLEESRLVFIWDVVPKLNLALETSELNRLFLGDRVRPLADGIPHLEQSQTSIR